MRIFHLLLAVAAVSLIGTAAMADSHRYAYMVLKCSKGNFITSIFHYASAMARHHGEQELEEAIITRFAKDNDSQCEGYVARFTTRALAEKYWAQMVEGVRQFCPGREDGKSHCTGPFTFVKIYPWPPPRIRIVHEGLQNCVRPSERIGEPCGEGNRLFVSAENLCPEAFQIQICIERPDENMDCASRRKVGAGALMSLSTCDSTGNWWYIACPIGQACDMRN